MVPPSATQWSPPASRAGRHPSLTLAVLSLVLVAAGGAALLDAARVVSVSAIGILALALVLVGAGLVASAWVGRARGLLAVGVLLTVVLGASLAAGRNLDISLRGGMGARTWHPLAVADVRREYHLGIGKLTVDLSRVDGLPVAGDATVVDARVGVGGVVVIVPADADVTVAGRVGAGALRYFDVHDGGTGVRRSARSSGPGARLVLRLRSGVGQVEVRRAAA